MASKDSNDDALKDKPDNSEDNFGLPDIEYKPLDPTSDSSKAREQVASAETSGYSDSSSTVETRSNREGNSSYDPMAMDEPKSKAPIILGIVIVLVVAIAGYLIFNFVYKPKAAAEKARQEQIAKDAQLKKKQAEEERLRKQQEEEERKRLEAIANAKPVIGTIETLGGRTKRYYVVVTSDIDDDLLLDFAKKLSTKGISTKIIPPYGEVKFYRLAIADHDTWASAQSNADAAKVDYGSGVWVIKY